MAKKISVLIKEPGMKPRHVWISDTLENLQRTVGGYIETVTPGTDWCIVCDEEGRIKNKPYNCTIVGVDFVGTIILAGVKGENFADFPLTWHRAKQQFPQLWKEEA